MTARAPRLVLASGSPRRRELLAEAGFDFQVIVPAVAESFSPHLTSVELTCWNAVRKGLAVARAQPDALVLAADTLVRLDDEVIGKPRDLTHARKILRRLQGRAHLVTTGIFVGCLAKRRSELFAVTSKVIFKKRTQAQIETYLQKIDPLDKAGAYAAQGRGGDIITRLEGSRSNVIGLPIDEVRAALARFGLTPNEPSLQAISLAAALRVFRGGARGRGTKR